MTKSLIAEIAKFPSAASQYVAKYADEEYMWDELAAAVWLDPSIITKEEKLYMDINIDHARATERARMERCITAGARRAICSFADGSKSGKI